LASRLSGWKLDVRSVSVAEEETKRARQSLEAIPNINFTYAELLFQEGYRSAKDVADASLEEIMEIEGFSAELASEILKNAREHVDRLETEGAREASLAPNSVTDLDKLAITPELKAMLLGAGFRTIQSLVVADPNDLLAIEGVGEEEMTAIKDATDGFLRPTPRL
jgi:transcription termination factor NusA